MWREVVQKSRAPEHIAPMQRVPARVYQALKYAIHRARQRALLAAGVDGAEATGATKSSICKKANGTLRAAIRRYSMRQASFYFEKFGVEVTAVGTRRVEIGKDYKRKPADATAELAEEIDNAEIQSNPLKRKYTVAELTETEKKRLKSLEK